MRLGGCDCFISKNGPKRSIIQHDAIDKYDPRGLSEICNKFRTDMDARWARLSVKTQAAIRDADLFGIHKPRLYETGDDKVAAFQRWFDQEMIEAVMSGNGSWLHAYSDHVVGLGKDRVNIMRMMDFNPNHEPGGSSIGGEFATGKSGDIVWRMDPGQEKSSGYEGSSAAIGEATPTKYTREVDALRDKNIQIDWHQRQALDMYTDDNTIFQGSNHLPLHNAESDSLDNLARQFSTPHDLVLYRRVGWSHWNDKLTAQVGKDFVDPNFMSTSLDPNLTFHKGSYIELHVPKGTAALPVGSLSNYPEEAEVLFPRMTRIHIESAANLSIAGLQGPNEMKFVARVVS